MEDEMENSVRRSRHIKAIFKTEYTQEILVMICALITAILEQNNIMNKVAGIAPGKRGPRTQHHVRVKCKKVQKRRNIHYQLTIKPGATLYLSLKIFSDILISLENQFGNDLSEITLVSNKI